jgi:prophage maintenance system killer protein
VGNAVDSIGQVTRYLSAEALVAINAEHGGTGAGVADRPGIESAAHRPQTNAFGTEFYPDVWSKAAAYLHSLASTQYFTDGNKRTAWLAAMTFLTLNGHRMPRVDDSDSEALVRCVAGDLFASDSEPDRTIEVAADWLQTRHEQLNRVGPAIDPRLEFVQLCHYYEVDHGQAVYSMANAGFDILPVPNGFPHPADFCILGRIHWRPADIGRPHTFTITVASLDGTKRVNRARKSETLSGLPVLTSDKWQYPNGIVPWTFATDIDAVFLEAGEYVIRLDIDGECAAEHALTVVDFGEPPPDIRLVYPST